MYVDTVRARIRRPRSISSEDVKRLLNDGVGASEVAKRLGIGRASVYRLAAEEV